MRFVPGNSCDFELSESQKSKENNAAIFLGNFQKIAQQREEYFQRQFVFLEDYISKVLEEHNLRYKSGTQEEEKVSMAKAKAREYFKNYASEIIRSLKIKYQEQQFLHIMPEVYFENALEKIKESISHSLDQLTERIIEAAAVIPSIEAKSVTIQKKGRKGKTKISKKALTTLKNWLTEHFQDPYPSPAEKIRLANEAGITLKQVQNWFTNARGRIWKKTCNPEKFSEQIEERLVIDNTRMFNMMSQFNNNNMNSDSMG